MSSINDKALNEIANVKLENTVIFSKNFESKQKKEDKAVFEAQKNEKTQLIPKEVSLDLLDIDILPLQNYNDTGILKKK